MISWLLSGITLAQAEAPSRSLFEYIRQGGTVGLVIILLSFAGLALLVTQLMRLRRDKLAPPAVVEQLAPPLRVSQIDRASTVCADPVNDCFLTRVIGAALLRCTRSPFGFLELRTALEEAGQHEVTRLHRATDGIGLIAAVAPMLGLLGTVIGMVGAFDAITLSEGPAKPDQLAGHISQALVTTVLGLIVAIPATAAYTWLRNRIDALAAELGETIEDLVAHLETATPGAAQGKPQA